MTAIKRKREAWSLYVAAGRGSHEKLKSEYASACKALSDEIRSAMFTFEERLARENARDPTLFHKYVRTKKKVEDVIRVLELPDVDATTTDHKVICGVLNNYFQSVFAVESARNLPSTELPLLPLRTHDICKFGDLDFTIVDVLRKLRELDPTKSKGADGIHPRVLLNCSRSFARPITLLFRRSIETKTVPECWKLSNVTPIFKQGSKLKPSNYRPVSLTSVLCKTLESLIHGHIMKFLNARGLINRAQHGFLKGRGCSSNLLETRDILTEAISKGLAVDVIYTDFSKAFDRVPHSRLLHKLSVYGIRGALLDWIKSWLVGRKQRVVIGDEQSEWVEVTSGVPQGSVLGPLFFLIYINDLPDSVACHIKLYADDSKLIRVIKSEQDAQLLQADIDAAVEWSHRWALPFNVAKCKVMHFGRPVGKSFFEYSMANPDGTRAVLETTSVERDLGVQVSNDLKLRKQVEAAAARANSEIGRLKKSFRSRSCVVWRMLYLSYIRPHLEYAINAWSPYLEGDMNVLERVQNRVTKLITCLKGMSADERAKSLGLTSLKTRRERSDLIEEYKIKHGLNALDFYVPQVDLNPGYAIRHHGHDQRLKPQFVKHCELRESFFTNRVAEPWNALPQEAVNAESLDMFKGHLVNLGYACEPSQGYNYCRHRQL